MSKALEALEIIKHTTDLYTPNELNGHKKELDVIATDLILLNALRNNINRKVETTEYKHAESNSYRITTLLTYELKERWDDMELEALTQFLLNLSGISKKLKALEIIKEKRVNVRAFLKCCHEDYGLTVYNSQCNDEKERESKELIKEEYELLKEILL